MNQSLRSNFQSFHANQAFDALEIAVLIPCYNEAEAIAKVVKDFQAALPTATIYVYDNNSTDKTVIRAQAAGAIVRREPRQGKGHVVRRMFADVEADVYLMVDGDDTYDATAAPEMVRLMTTECLDLVNGTRSAVSTTAYRPGHKLGNMMLSGLVQKIFGTGATDMLSGYRVFSNRFVKSFPIMSRGFEIETELTVHALELQMPLDEVASSFRDRPEGSESKLNSIRDGVRILRTILRLARHERPLWFFSLVAGLLAIAALGLAAPVITEYFATGLVPRLPTAVLSASLMIIACLSGAVGMVLDLVTRARQEAKRMQYLSIPGVATKARPQPTSQKPKKLMVGQ
ncbi:Glycosyltransferase involved in cell wall bisynthesis [Shimia gijangensis]|uniref:Glycosyltransferase involved in cell wall bisynthesis n=1 Tax=Shimia gijangensis TaxID=1470563 RepID=A0A1M6QJ94_9RHOB|nr:glycosyltransferase family 2 protein [Shimia gijangensis]SHK20349.1 Glycosyltransferase involved in cell wall bisynthesis [Shimia gijangensis]